MFKIQKFEDDALGDATCNKLFSTAASKSKKNTIKQGRILKNAPKVDNKTLKVKKSEIRKEILSILKDARFTDTTKPVQSGIENTSKNKTKKRKRKRNLEEEGNSFTEQKEKSDKRKQKNKIAPINLAENSKQKKKEPVVETTSNDNEIDNNTEQKKKKRKKKKKTNDDKAAYQNPSGIHDSIPSKPTHILFTEPHDNEQAPIKIDFNQKKTDIFNNKLKQVLNPSLYPNQELKLNKKNKNSNESSLRSRMIQQLKAARFRLINEEIYSNDGKQAQNMFNNDPEAFQAYHEGYRQQVNKWPLNPVDIIIKSLQKIPKTHVIADFGCGDAKISESVNHKVHSFDLVAANDRVVACNMAHVPLGNSSVDVVVFCLSLMGTNLHDYLMEANRVLKKGGLLKMAEVESRFDDINKFIEGLSRFNFKNTWKDLSHNLFYFLDFKKEDNIKNKKKLPTISLHPCLYKKR